ncbi:MAG: hypothetical protein F6J90_29280 [Moorea sp. SIOASIH]|uniref:hypothetical protein n=1 Tax=Moorena sp. SIOASIH TaxID=2607817 RepID=UPI0013BA19C9|nr:hypothetical protein [Moorena sp. SIOASIH]NEO40216.1 hypothetical protein [Moorena sp. SIOASIH]
MVKRASGVEPASWVELASCQFHAYYRAGILPWNWHQVWNWHLASFKILSGGQDAHSTPIHGKIQQPSIDCFAHLSCRRTHYNTCD